MEEENKKEDKRILRKVIIVIAFLSTYIMVFLLGRITNIITLGDREATPQTVQTPDTQTPSENTKTPEFYVEPIPDNTEETEEIPVDGIIKLIEKSSNKTWEQLEELKIFESDFYDTHYSKKIAPGFFGEYEFIVENNWNKPVKYTLKFEEENKDKINLVYKLKNGENYILGNEAQAVYLSGVKLDAVTIPAKSRTVYKLFWKWEDTDYDTELGLEATAKYKISIGLDAEVVEE